MCEAIYSRSPQRSSSSLERQSTITGSSMCEASTAVETSVVNDMAVRYHFGGRAPPTTATVDSSNSRSRMMLLLAAIALAAAVDTPAHVDAVAITPNNSTRVNGELTEELLQTARPSDAFVQREPEEGGRPSQRTEFRVAYDASTLFVRVHAFDTEPQRIVSYLTPPDADSPSDWIPVRIDSHPATRTAFEV